MLNRYFDALFAVFMTAVVLVGIFLGGAMCFAIYQSFDRDDPAPASRPACQHVG